MLLFIGFMGSNTANLADGTIAKGKFIVH